MPNAKTTAAKTAAETNPVPNPVPESYEAAMAELDTLVASMESGELPLEASLAAYRRGAELVKYCQQVLERVEQQVRVLDGEALKPLGAPGDDEA